VSHSIEKRAHAARRWVKRETMMTKSFIAISLLLLASSAQAQAQSYPIADKAAAMIVQKYSTSSCETLAQERKAPPTAQKEAMKAKLADALRQNAGMRASFVAKVAPTIANKMIECGFIP
jgi:hypothetical protein